MGLIVLGRRTTWPMLCAASDGHPTRTMPRDSPGVTRKDKCCAPGSKLDEGGYLRTMPGYTPNFGSVGGTPRLG
eukprot:scaffold57442_cov70-Phaeocystis_antarctica.AAC.12